MDAPKTLGSMEARQQRLAAIEDRHVAPLSTFVRSLRTEMGSGYEIPYFDPLDGGVTADCLYLLEAPGPRAVASGFISRNNPDETAKNFFLLNREAGIDRRRTIIWNIVPWYIGSGTRIRPANARDLDRAGPALVRLAGLLPALHSVVLVGKKAATAESAVRTLLPSASVYSIPHPSPMFVNRLPGNRALLLEKLRLIARNLPRRPDAD